MGGNFYYSNSSGYCNIANKILQTVLRIVFITLSIIFNAFITAMIQCQLYWQYWKCILYILIHFTLHISQFSVQRTFYNQPAETFLKAKKVSLQKLLTYRHEVIQLLQSVFFQIFMFRITKSVGMMKGFLMEFHLLQLLQECYTVNIEKTARRHQK